VLAAPLGGWLVSPPPLSAFAALWQVIESSVLGVPCHAPDSSAVRDQLFTLPNELPGQVQHSTSPSMSVLDYSLLFMAFSLLGGGQSAQKLH
jgi:hypothetical protein